LIPGVKIKIMKKSPVIHFEMPYKDPSRVSRFYSEAFGWDMSTLGADMGNYVLAGTTDTDQNQMVTTPGTINGGFFEYKDEDGFRIPSVVISVDSLQEAMEQVKSAGGTVLGEPYNIPGIGEYVAIRDTEDNRVGLLQPEK
jgi:uncharacterized protein